MKTIGYCKDCKFRDKFGNCTNDEKLHENDYRKQTEEQKSDNLIYCYFESGGFWVGEYFGCIHWVKAT